MSPRLGRGIALALPGALLGGAASAAGWPQQRWHSDAGGGGSSQVVKSSPATPTDDGFDCVGGGAAASAGGDSADELRPEEEPACTGVSSGMRGSCCGRDGCGWSGERICARCCEGGLADGGRVCGAGAGTEGAWDSSFCISCSSRLSCCALSGSPPLSPPSSPPTPADAQPRGLSDTSSSGARVTAPKSPLEKREPSPCHPCFIAAEPVVVASAASAAISAAISAAAAPGPEAGEDANCAAEALSVASRWTARAVGRALGEAARQRSSRACKLAL